MQLSQQKKSYSINTYSNHVWRFHSVCSNGNNARICIFHPISCIVLTGSYVSLTFMSDRWVPPAWEKLQHHLQNTNLIYPLFEVQRCSKWKIIWKACIDFSTRFASTGVLFNPNHLELKPHLVIIIRANTVPVLGGLM